MMKTIKITTAFTSLLLILLSFINVGAWAQDSTVSSHTTVTTKTTESFVVQPWMWVVGGAVLLVVLVALLRGSSNKEVTKTTVIRD